MRRYPARYTLAGSFEEILLVLTRIKAVEKGYIKSSQTISVYTT